MIPPVFTLVFFLGIVHLTCVTMSGDLPLTCENRILMDGHTRGIAVEKKNYSITSPYKSSLPLNLDPCSHRMVNKLRLDWNVTLPADNSPDAGDQFLVCVNVHHLSTRTINSSCYELSMDGLNGTSRMHCLFDTSGFHNQFIVNAYVTVKKRDVELHYFGEFSTTNIDYRETCRYLCDLDHPYLRNAYSCLHPSFITVENTTLVKSMSLRDDTNGTVYTIPFDIKSLAEIEFTLPNLTDGRYQLEMLTHHSLSGIFCSFTKSVEIFCDGPITVTTSESIPALGQPFKQFVIFAVITATVIISVIVTVTLGLYRLSTLDICKKKTPPTEEGRPLKPKRRISLPNLFRHNHNHLPPVNKHFVDIINDINEFGPVPGQHTCMELTERPTFLFVPIPYDSFTIQIMNCIRPILTQEGRFTSRCIFDDGVYITDELKRYRWTESVVQDNKQIIVFLCFTSPTGARYERTLADELLDQFLRSRIRPQCSAFLVLVTNEDKRHVLGKTYHGSIIHLMQKNEYERLLREVFQLCGLTFNPGSDGRLNSIIRSRESVHFLSMIGHNQDEH